MGASRTLSNKFRLILECIYHGWQPVPKKCSRLDGTLVFAKGGLELKLSRVDLRIYAKAPRKHLVRAVYKQVQFARDNPSLVHLSGAHLAQILNLEAPSIRNVHTAMPDFKFIQNFVLVIQKMTQKTGRPPLQNQLIDEIFGLSEGALSKKSICTLLMKGEGYFWECQRTKGPPNRCYYFIMPWMGLTDAVMKWRDQCQPSELSG